MQQEMSYGRGAGRFLEVGRPKGAGGGGGVS